MKLPGLFRDQAAAFMDSSDSLLYEKAADGYRLKGAMFTTPKGMSEEELDSRVPLSVTSWTWRGRVPGEAGALPASRPPHDRRRC